MDYYECIDIEEWCELHNEPLYDEPARCCEICGNELTFAEGADGERFCTSCQNREDFEEAYLYGGRHSSFSFSRTAMCLNS